MNTYNLLIRKPLQGNEACSFCPKEFERRCDERCAEGLKEWLEKECDPEDDIWKEGF